MLLTSSRGAVLRQSDARLAQELHRAVASGLPGPPHVFGGGLTPMCSAAAADTCAEHAARDVGADTASAS